MGLVIARSGNSIRVELEAAGHRFVADEPVASGGTNEGPTPYDFIAAGLAGCTSMTMQIVAKRENMPLEGIELKVTSDREHAEDCADCASTSGYIHRFKVEIKLNGNLTEAQRARLQQVASRCPVAKMLMSEIKIDEVFL